MRDKHREEKEVQRKGKKEREGYREKESEGDYSSGYCLDKIRK